MRGTIGGIFLLLALLVAGIGLLAPGCGGKSREDRCREALEGDVWEDVLENCPIGEVGSELLLEAGIAALRADLPGDAKTFFMSIGAGEPVYGSARYGMMLAEWQAFVRNAFSPPPVLFFSPGRGFAGEGFQTNQTSLDLGYTFLPLAVMDDARSLRQLADEAVASGWTITMDDFPVKIGQEGEDLYVNLVAGGSYGELYARLVRLVADAFLFFLDYVSAHSLVIDAESLMSVFLEESDFIGIVRRLAQIPADSPTFLQKREGTWNSNIGEMIDEILAPGAENLKEIEGALGASAVPVPEDCSGVICLVDRDGGDGISAGDQILVRGNMQGEVKAGFFRSLGISYDYNLVSSVALLVDELAVIGVHLEPTIEKIEFDIDFSAAGFLGLTGYAAEIMADLFGPLGTLLDAAVASSQSDTSYVGFSDVTPVLASLGLPDLPDAARLNLKRFFDMPWGNLIAYYCEGLTAPVVSCGAPDAYPAFPVELEMRDVAAQCSEGGFCGFEPYPDYYREGDTGHFPGTSFQIPQDGIEPGTVILESERRTDMLIYAAVADPTLNGALGISLGALPAACDPEGEPGYAEDPTDYSLNKVLNCLLVSYYPRLQESELVRMILDLGGPLVFIP